MTGPENSGLKVRYEDRVILRMAGIVCVLGGSLGAYMAVGFVQDVLRISAYADVREPVLWTIATLAFSLLLVAFGVVILWPVRSPRNPVT